MKQFLTLFLIAFAWVTNAQTQTPNNEIVEYATIDENLYVTLFNSFKIDSACDQKVLVTFIDKNYKSYSVDKSEISEKLKKWIHKPGMKYVFTGSTNSGYVISISQLNQDELYSKFITIFTSYQTGKITVIEISNNKE